MMNVQTTRSILWLRTLGVLAGIGLMLSAAVPYGRAQTVADLQAQINQLLAVLSSLQGGSGQAHMSDACPFTWTRSLGTGSSGADVLKLQQFLNADADTRVATVGAGSTGMETQYYGPATAAAVSKFQVKYRADILTPSGLVNPTGYFGPSSRAKANALCVLAPSNPQEEPEDPDRSELRGGEASLERFSVSSGDDRRAFEGQNYAEVLEAEFRVEDGDVRVNRIDVAFDHIAGGDDDPWDVFEDVSIWVDGDRIAEMDVDDEDAWQEDAPENGDYRLRFTDLDDWVIREGDRGEFTVAVSVAGNVDDAGSVEWELFIPDQGIRATDSERINNYTGDTDRTVRFEIEEAGADDELIVRNSTDDPDSTTLQLEDNGRSDWHTVFAFDLDTDDSINDIEIEHLPVAITLSSSTVNARINDMRLVIDKDQYDDYSLQNGGTNSAVATFDFDRDELVIDAGDRVTAELQVRFNQLPDALEGMTIRATTSADDIEAEGEDDLAGSQLSGAASSDLHVLRTAGVLFAERDTTARVQEGPDGADDRGLYTVRFNVTAFESDVFVNNTTASGTALGTAGVNYLIEGSDGEAVAAGVENAVLTSDATRVGNRYRVSEGQTRTFTLTVSYDPIVDGFYRMQLYSLNFNESNDNPDVQQRAVPENRYETNFLSLDA